MSEALFALRQKRVPTKKEQILHVELVLDFLRMLARTETTTCYAKVRVRSFRRNEMVTNFNPVRPADLKDVDAHFVLQDGKKKLSRVRNL